MLIFTMIRAYLRPVLAALWYDRSRRERADLLFNVLGFGLAVWALLIARDAFNDQTRLSSYELISTAEAAPATKIRAMQELMKRGDSVIGVAANCDDANGCGDIDAIELTGIVQHSQLSGLTFLDPRLHDLHVGQSTMDNDVMSGGSLLNVRFYRTSLRSTAFPGTALSRVILYAADMTGANLSRTQLLGVAFNSVNLSGVRFCDYIKRPARFAKTLLTFGDPNVTCVAGLKNRSVTFPFSWFYADDPPKGLEAMAYDNLPFLESCPRAVPLDGWGVPTDVSACTVVSLAEFAHHEPVPTVYCDEVSDPNSDDSLFCVDRGGPSSASAP